MQKHDTKWKDEPEAKIKRVFRTTKVPFELDKRILGTVNRQEGTENGTTVRPLLIKKKFNHAGQYVLQDNEQEYNRQLGALRRAEGNSKILEVDPTWEGKPFIPAPPPDERDKQIRELKEELAAAKAGKSKTAPKPVAKTAGDDGEKGDPAAPVEGAK